MAEAVAYLLTLALFSFVIVASARMRDEMLLLACIPPVFVALIVGFVMALYAGDTFGMAPTGAALALGAPPGWLAGAPIYSKGPAGRDLPRLGGGADRGADRLRLPRPK